MYLYKTERNKASLQTRVSSPPERFCKHNNPIHVLLKKETNLDCDYFTCHFFSAASLFFLVPGIHPFQEFCDIYGLQEIES